MKLLNIMNNTIKHFENYIAKKDSTWNSRFTWRGRNGKDPKHTISIMKFAAETGAFKSIEHPNNTTDLFTVINNLSNVYVNWVKTKKDNYSKDDLVDLKAFFIGAIGEFFVVKLLTDVKCLMVSNDGDGNFTRYDFNYVSPTVYLEADNGIDVYCIANDIQSVMQVKFWSPFSKAKIEPDVYRYMIGEGAMHKYINLEENNNTFLFWLGGEHAGKMSINKDKEKMKHAVVIGKQTLDASINGRNQIFWDSFYSALENIR